MTDPPYAVPVDEAARLVGCKNTKQFKREVNAGIWPGPLPINSRPERYSPEALKRRVDEMTGLAARSPDSMPWIERLHEGGI